MSYQHLYSRVPARVSIYNKRDGFDTFAHSGLAREFVLGELSCVYSGKLELHDPLKIRRGEISTVYSQKLLPAGVVAQTAISYDPVDFTGERSAYFAHTLILSDAERASVLNNPNADCFNPDVFYKDIKRFNLTLPTAAPNSACPELNYTVKPLSDHKATIKQYDPEMVKSFIYSVLCAICEDGREVIFHLPTDDRSASCEALSLINAIMSVLPYGLRERMSFVTFVSHPEHYQGFKIKCLSEGYKEVSPEVGVFYDFAEGTVSGMPSGYDKNMLLASFFYSLFEYPRIRNEFLPFVERITDKYKSCTLDIDTLRDIVFLFWQCSGFYVEETVVTGDDALCNLMDVYGKYRDGLITEHRVRMYKPLSKYSSTHTAIPDGVFSRLSALYPTDCVEAKAVALDVLLKLIHVDLMRDSLFCFISRYYDSEIDSVKAIINANLSRVFYGGFLQQQILAFFDAHFRAEPVQTRDIILDKLLLSVRTPEIQRQILIFLDRHYPAFNSTQKMKICNTCLEMLSECDILSELFVSLINRRIGREGGDIASLMAIKLTELLNQSLSRGDGRLASIFVQNSGFCEELALRFVLESGVGSEIMVAILAAMPAHKRGDKLVRAYKVTNQLNTGRYLDFILRFTQVVVAVAPTSLKDILHLDKMAALALPADIIGAFRERVIYPVIGYVFADVFKAEYGKEGLAELIQYAESNPAITALPQYGLIVDYLAIVHKSDLGDTEAVFKIIANLPDSPEIKANIGRYIKNYVYDPDEQDEETACIYQLVINLLTAGKLGMDRIYSAYLEQFEEEIKEEGGLIGGLNADRKAAAKAIELIISCASDICSASDSLVVFVKQDDSGLKRAISDFISLYGLGAGQVLKKCTADAHYSIESMAEDLIAERNASISSVGDAVDLILRRK